MVKSERKARDNIMKKTISFILSFMLTISLIATPAFAEAGMSNFKRTLSYTEGKYTDVSSSDWFSKNVADAYEYNLMQGMSENTFGASSYVRISEAVAMAARLHSIYTTGKADFSMSTPWYKSYVDYALANGIISERRFENYELYATRYQVAEIFAASMPSSELKAINNINIGDIPDVSLETPYQCVYTLYSAGVLTGKTDAGNFFPAENILRNEMAVVVTRMANAELRVKFSINTSPSEGIGSKAQLVTTVDNARQSIVLALERYIAACSGFSSPKLEDRMAAQIALEKSYEYALMATQHTMNAANYCKSNNKYSSAYDDLYNSYLGCIETAKYIKAVAAAPVASTTDWLSAKTLMNGCGEALSRAADTIKAIS
jgi:hypothetical protein